ncbi:Acyl carrier protein [compost metagenome]
MTIYVEEVKTIILKHINLDHEENSISADTDLKTVGLNSIDFVKLVVEFESAFDIEIPEDKLLFSEMDTIGKICGIIKECKQ